MTTIINTIDELDNLFINNDIVVCMFTATWCGPCKIIKPIYYKLSDNIRYNEKIKFAQIDIDDGYELAEKYNIKSIPTFIVFINGKEEEYLQGSDSTKLQNLLDKFL